MGKEKDQIDEVALRDRLLLSEDEVAFVCGVSRPTVRRWRAEGLLRTVELPFNLRRNLYRRATSRPSSKACRRAASRPLETSPGGPASHRLPHIPRRQSPEAAAPNGSGPGTLSSEPDRPNSPPYGPKQARNRHDPERTGRAVRTLTTRQQARARQRPERKGARG